MNYPTGVTLPELDSSSGSGIKYAGFGSGRVVECGQVRVIPISHVAGFGSGSRVFGSGILRQFQKKFPVQKF